MNVLTPAAQAAAHDIASGVRGSIRPQQAPRRLDIADLAELATKPARPAEQPAPQDAGPQNTESASDSRPIRPGTFLDIRV